MVGSTHSFADPLLLLVFCAFIASIAYVRQQHGRQSAWDIASRVGRLTHVVVRTVSHAGADPTFRIIDGVKLYLSVVASSNREFWNGRTKRERLKYLVMLLVGTPTAFMSMFVRLVNGYPPAGGVGALPALMTVAHICSMFLATSLFVEAAAQSFELLALLKCRAKVRVSSSLRYCSRRSSQPSSDSSLALRPSLRTPPHTQQSASPLTAKHLPPNPIQTLGEIKCTDDAEEAEAHKADTFVLDLRHAEGCVAWAKLREYMMEERKIDHALVETCFLAAIILIGGHALVLASVILGNLDDTVSLSIGSVVMVFSSLWAIFACSAFRACFTVPVIFSAWPPY